MNSQSNQTTHPEIINIKYLAFRVGYARSNRKHIIWLPSSPNAHRQLP